MPRSHEKKTAGFPVILYQPWFYFSIFVATNLMLSYCSFGLETKLWVGILGWAVPFGLGLVTLSAAKPEKLELHKQEVLPSIPRWVWWSLALSAIFIRLYILLNNAWPLPDDALTALPSVELSKSWEWHFCFTVGQLPPLFNWILALFFKIFVPSLFSMRLYLFSLSTFALIFIYTAANQFFSKSLAFLLFIFCAFGFWPLYGSRFCINNQLLLLIELLAMGSLARFLRAPSSAGLPKQASLLGFWTSLGFWTGISWPLSALMIGAAVFNKLKSQLFGRNLKPFLLFLIPLLLSALLYYFLSFQEGNGQHVRDLLSLSPSENWVKRLNDSLSNWTALFWGCNPQNSYGPIWGGMLNPVEGGLFFVGILDLIRNRHSAFSKWILTSFFLFMIPGTITQAFEMFRNSLVIPILIVVCALGTQTLLISLPFQKRLATLAVLILSFASLNIIHLEKTFEPKGDQAGPSHFTEGQTLRQAYEILREVEGREGQGLILQDLLPNFENQTLGIATYSFNPANNPKLNPSLARWVAVIENTNYKSFLAKRFPLGQGYEIGPDPFWNDGGLMLWVIPIGDSNRPDFLHWLELDQQLHNITRETYFDNSRKHQPEIFNHLLSLENHLQGDPFLESVFFEHVFYYRRVDAPESELLTWVQKALENGYPLPHLLVREGVYLQKTGHPQAAREAFKKALQAPFNSPSAKENLRILDLLEKNIPEKPQGNNLNPSSHESSR